jgi:pilus assembly protein CpaF
VITDRELVSSLKIAVGDRLQEWVSAGQRNGATPDADDQRQFAITVATEQVRLVDRERLVRGQTQMAQGEVAMLVREVVAALFDAGGFTAVFDRPDMANLAVNGIEAYGELVTGETIPLGRIAASEAEVIELVQQLLSTQSRTSRTFNSAHPLVSAQLSNGMRLTASMEVSDSVSVSIRRAVLRNVSLAELVKLGTLTTLSADFLAAVVHGELNVVIGGGTNSGKTTMIRALCDEIPATDRLVVVEDAAELNLKHPIRHPDVVSLETRLPNVEGVGEVTLGELCKHALRMSPKRLICGEIRSGNEAMPVLSAMTTGNDGSMTTIHARTAENSLEKLRTLLGIAIGIDAPVAADLISQAVDIVLYLHQDRASGKRLVMSIREVTGHEGSQILTNAVFTRQSDGVLRPTATVSERLRERLLSVGFDPRRMITGLAS